MLSYHKKKKLNFTFSLLNTIHGIFSSSGMTTTVVIVSSITSLAKKQKNYTFHLCHLIANTRQKQKNYTFHYVILSQTLAKNKKKLHDSLCHLIANTHTHTHTHTHIHTHEKKNIISSYSRNSSSRSQNILIV